MPGLDQPQKLIKNMASKISVDSDELTMHTTSFPFLKQHQKAEKCVQGPLKWSERWTKTFVSPSPIGVPGKKHSLFKKHIKCIWHFGHNASSICTTKSEITFDHITLHSRKDHIASTPPPPLFANRCRFRKRVIKYRNLRSLIYLKNILT